MNVKVFNLTPGVNEVTFESETFETFEGKCGLNESVCNSKQKWKHDE